MQLARLHGPRTSAARPCRAGSGPGCPRGPARLVARVVSRPERGTAEEDAAGAGGAAGAAAAAAVAADAAAQRSDAGDARRVQQLQLNVAHYTVDGAALPADHPDHEEPLAAAAARLIPADHPEAPQQEVQQQQEQPAAAKQQHARQDQRRRRQPQARTQRDPAQQPQQQQQRARQPPRPRDPRFGQPIKPEIALGDIVYGEVVSDNGTNGARVRVLNHEGIIGFVPAARYGADGARLPVGLVRAFKVLKVPQDMTFDGHGPLLSALDADTTLAWRRVQQAFELFGKYSDVLEVTVTGHNSGGLLAEFMGNQAFIPFSAVDKPAGGQCDVEAMVGKRMEVAPIECNNDRKAITMSEKAASTVKMLRKLQPGSLVLGSVKRVTPNMAWVRLDGVRCNFAATLHASNFSCNFTRSLEDHLEPQERIMAIVKDVQLDQGRVQLSTAHLEVSPGDMQRDRRAVFATADRQAAVVRRQMEEAAQEQEQDWCDAPAVASVDH
ncbi:hypothetical protein Rsub_10662 [Raphidocelis subcapitata]|uniref:S1 motif domain-containing protein n=1 Tax=Raphidocelis subcapitata TaxID=307507 RepID=A0A2V0PDQ4_9CHLO|nr:hypothetical protein Rsub_10662 [Raphidocelis subcapitata]|eukprot:GBF97988.1 hypothetical protein Rsub_10662 [Raphidocelis subcapitata]